MGVTKCKIERGLMLAGKIVGVAMCVWWFGWRSVPQVQAGCLLNIADVTLSNYQACVNAAPQGTTVSILMTPTTSSMQQVQYIINAMKGTPHNLEIRMYTPNRAPTQAEVQSVVAFLGRSGMTNKAALRVWNEPNHPEEFGPGYSSPEAVAAKIVEVQRWLREAIDQAGMAGVILAESPMLDHWTGGSYSVESLVPMMAQQGFFDLIDIWTINMYTDPNSPGYIKGKWYRDLLSEIGVPADMLLSASEAGALHNGRVSYDPAMLKMVFNAYLAIAANDPHMLSMSLFNRDPLGGFGGYTLVGNPELMSLLANAVFNSPSAAAFLNDSQFQAWLQNLLDKGVIVECYSQAGSFVGFAPDETACTALPGFYDADLAACIAGATGNPDNYSRQFECSDCYQTVPEPSASCANTFTINARVNYSTDDGHQCTDANAGIYANKTWGGRIVVDPTKANIPFVGTSDLSIPGYERVQQFLADYLTGTAIYDGVVYDPSTEEGRQKIQTEHDPSVGVARRLIPNALQDDLRRDIIRRANESQEGTIMGQPVNNYYIKYPGYQYKARLVEFADHIKPDQDDYATTEDYQQALLAWNNNKPQREDYLTTNDYLAAVEVWKDEPASRWAVLWPAVPLFSLEDTPARITLYSSLEGKGLDKLEVKDKDSLIMYVPHVARLYESSKFLSEMLLPLMTKRNNQQTKETGSALLASNRVMSPNSNLLALADGCESPFSIGVDNVSYSGGQLYYSVALANTPDTGGPECHLYVNNKFWGGCITTGGIRLDAGASGGLVEPVPAGPNGTFTINANAKLDRHSKCGVTKIMSTSCQVAMRGGVVESTTCGQVKVEPPRCDMPNQEEFDACEIPAEFGSGDTLCCNPVVADFKSIERVRVSNPGVQPPQYKQQEVQRDIEVELELPYLESIWGYLVQGTTDGGRKVPGLLKAFNIHGVESLNQIIQEDMPGAGDIYYEFHPDPGKESGQRAAVEPGVGAIKYPHLYAILEARNWLVKMITAGVSGGSR